MLRASHDCTIVHLGETLSCNGIFRATTTRVLHLLGACPIVLCLACGSQWTNILKCLDSSIFTKTLPYRLVLRKLVHEHLLVRLRGCKHIGISFRGHFDELFVVSLHLGHVLIRDLMRRVSTGRPNAALSIINANLIDHLIRRNIYGHVSWQVLNVKSGCLTLRSDICDWSGSFLTHHLHALSLSRLQTLFVI